MQASWDSDISTYSEAELRSMFSRHGIVQEVVPRPAKKKNKGSALVVMEDIEVGALTQDITKYRVDLTATNFQQCRLILQADEWT